MAVNLSPVGGVAAQFFDNSGQVLTGGKLYTYLAGTTTPAVTYTTNSGIVANSNPIVLNAAGRVADSGEIWLTDGINYKFVLKDSNDVQIAVWDNIIGINSNFVNYTLQEQTFTATQGQTVFTLTGGIQYTPTTSNLAVYVNGSKQVAGTNYIETSSTVFTFVTGLNVGDVVDALTAIPVATNVISSNNVSYNQGGTGAVTTNVQAKLSQYVSVIDFGADPTGATNSSTAIQNAINASNAVYIPAGTYRCDTPILINSSYTNRKYVLMTGATKLNRLSAYSSATGPVIELLGNYGHFDGGFGEIMSENDSGRGVVCLGQRDTNTLSTGNGLFWSFSNCDVRCKSYVSAPTVGATVGVYIPSAQSEKGSNYATYFGTVSNVRVFGASISYWLTDAVNANTFVNCAIEFFWHYGWRLNGAYGNTIYGGFINGCYQNGGYGIYLGNKLDPSGPYAPSHQSNNNSIFGITMELYTSGNYGLYIPAGVSGYSSAHNFVQFNWNSTGTSVTDLTASGTNTINDGNTISQLGENLQMPNNTLSGYNLLQVGTTAYLDAHAIARTAPSGGPALIVENLNTAASTSAGLQVRWNTPTIGYAGAIISAYHVPTTTTRFQVLDSGNVQNTNNSYGAISDVSLKENIVDATPKLNDLMNVKIRQFNLKNDENKTKQIGVIAQELEEVFPSMIETDIDGIKGVKYSVFVPMLIKALQELKTEFDEYKANHP